MWTERCTIACILVIDDDSAIRTFLRKVLEDAGYTVLLASNGREGLRLLQVSTADLVITDVLMPEQDGLDVTMALRRASPDMRIVAISGGTAEFDYLDVAKELGAHRTLRKPLIVNDLLEAIRQELLLRSGRAGRQDGRR
jgi:two-component system response regulator (stage 0 sporulation protein F)